MVIKFYALDPSPPCRAVSMVFGALNLEFETVVTDIFTGATKTPEYLAMNPRGKIPCIEDGDFAISESRAIATYLCNQYEKGADSTRLYPVDAKARGLVDQLLYASENTTDAIMGYVNLGGVLFGSDKKPNETKLPKVEEALKLFEVFLTRNKYMAGDHITLADFFMSSPLIVLPVTGEFDLGPYPKTQAWIAEIKALPYYEAANKEGVKILFDMYQAKMNA